MDRAARIRIIQRVGRTLSGLDWADAGLILSEYGIPFAGDFHDYDSTYEYMLERLRQGGDPVLAEIDRSLHEVGVDHPTTGDFDGGPWKAGVFRLFISHTSRHRRRAKSLARVFAPYGIEAFVAHHTIQPTREWELEIVSALRTCEALCAILTNDFVRSPWCDQEVGYVLARRKLVIPLRVDADPHGFMGKVQAVTFPHGAHAAQVADAILNALIRSPMTAESIAPAIVRRFVQSSDHTPTGVAFEMLRAIPREAWTSDMVAQVEQALSSGRLLPAPLLPDGTPLSRATRNLLADIAGPSSSQVASTADDDIPF